MTGREHLAARLGRRPGRHARRRGHRVVAAAVRVRHPLRAVDGLPRVRGVPDPRGARRRCAHPGSRGTRDPQHGGRGDQRGDHHGRRLRSARHPVDAGLQADGHRARRGHPARRDRRAGRAAAVRTVTARRAHLVPAPPAVPSFLAHRILPGTPNRRPPTSHRRPGPGARKRTRSKNRSAPRQAGTPATTPTPTLRPVGAGNEITAADRPHTHAAEDPRRSDVDVEPFLVAPAAGQGPLGTRVRAGRLMCPAS